MGEVIYGVVFGKPKIDDFYADCAKTGGPVDPNKMTANDPNAYVTEDGDILCLYSSGDLPSDSEPSNEPA